MRTKEHADAHASNNKATSHTEALAISHLTRVKRSTTRRIQKRANARHCRLKFIEFRLAVKRGEGKRGFKGSRNTTRPSSPANSDPLLARFQETGRANRQITFEPAPSGTTTVWYTHDSMPNKSNPVLPSHGFDSFDSTFGIWSNGVLHRGWRRTGERKVHVLTAKVNPSPPPLDFYLRAYGSGRMGRKVDDCLIKFERKFLFLVSASEAGFTVERDELRRYDRAFAWIYMYRIYDSWKDNVQMKSNYFRENLAISWNIYQWFRSNATWNDNFGILKNHREERITTHIEIVATQKDKNLPVEEATFSILFGNNTNIPDPFSFFRRWSNRFREGMASITFSPNDSNLARLLIWTIEERTTLHPWPRQSSAIGESSANEVFTRGWKRSSTGTVYALRKQKSKPPGVDVFSRETFRETSIPYEMAD